MAGGLTVVAVFHDPPDTASHITRECRFLAAIEAKRMVRMTEHGRAPAEVWRAEGKTGGAARPDLAGPPGADLPESFTSRLIQWLAPKRDLPPIDCTATFDAMQIPKMIKYNEGPPIQDFRLQYSRVTFLPGDDYTLFRRTECNRFGDRWDQKDWFELWRRRGASWEQANTHVVYSVLLRPRFELPMRCFDPTYPSRPYDIPF